MEKPRYDVVCPACSKTLSHKGLASHALGCRQWSAVVGTPYSEFNWDRYFKRGPYADGQVEGVDYVRCMPIRLAPNAARARIGNIRARPPGRYCVPLLRPASQLAHIKRER